MNDVDMIALIIVLFNPSQEDIDYIYDISAEYSGVVVDNSATRNFEGDQIGKMHYIPLMENTGIAHAQNVAIQFVQNTIHPKYILFFDQDSRCDKEFPLRMIAEYEIIKKDVPSLAMLGPTIVNNETGEAYKSCLHSDSRMANGFVTRREIISSGSLVGADSLKTVGSMLSSMFIDFVDFEWCWRARNKGFVCGVTENVSISHKVGVKDKTIGKYSLMVWKPFRYYYQYRNYIWLSLTCYTPWQWRVATGVKFLLRLIYFPLFISDGLNCWKQMLKGIRSSISGYAQFRKEMRSYA